MKENIRLSIRGILAHKMRSFLTMLGIIIGIASIIAIVSTIKGTNEQIEKNLIGSGENIVNLVLYQDDFEYDMSMGIPSGFKEINNKTKRQLLSIDHVENVSVFKKRQEFEAITYGDKKINSANVLGIDNSYVNAAGLTIVKGRNFKTSEKNKVCVLDDLMANQMFFDANPIGKIVEVHGTPFTVVGVLTSKRAFEPEIQSMEDYYMYHSNQTGSIYIPNEAWPIVYQYDEPENVILHSDETSHMTQVGKDAENVLNESITSSDVKYKTLDMAEQAKQIQQLSKSTNMMLIWIAAISLLVGGIGVMNIMLVTVTERTREIGLKKAIGARKKVILFQFLTESVVLTSLGGVSGIVIGIVFAKIISMINGSPVAISVPASLFAFAFSMLIGIVFGLLPSMKAANLDPIDALRYE